MFAKTQTEKRKSTERIHYRSALLGRNCLSISRSWCKGRVDASGSFEQCGHRLDPPFAGAVSNVARLERDDFIAALFCSVKKTLAMGVPLAQLIFGANGNLGLILLPIMFYHPFQLFVCGRWPITFRTSERRFSALGSNR
jgi:hypothetical protein